VAADFIFLVELDAHRLWMHDPAVETLGRHGVKRLNRLWRNTQGVTVLLEVVEGRVTGIVSDSRVTRLTIGDQVVWFRTSRSGQLPLASGDWVTVIAGRLGRERILIALRFRRRRDGYTFRPHKHSSIALQLAASVLLVARGAFGQSDLFVARVAVAPIAALGAGYLRAQIDIVAAYAARSPKRSSLPTYAPQVAVPPGAAMSVASKVSLGLQGAAPSATNPWWHSELLEYTHDAIIIWEMEGAGILYWNQAAEQLYGYSREEAQGKVTHDLLQTVTRKPVKELESTLARYGVWVGELRHTTSDGRIVEVEGRLSLMSQRNGRWLVLEVNRDITDRKRAQAARVAREASLSSLNLRR
jgi:PAS domain S-box-containing protein